MHQADGGGTLVDSVGAGGVVVLALAPGAAACHLAGLALVGALRHAVEGEERAQLVLVDTIANVADDEWPFLAQRVAGKASARIEIASSIYSEHLAGTAPVLIFSLRVERLANVLAEERACIVGVVATVDYGIGKLHELVLKEAVVTLLPHVLKHAVDVHLMDAQRVEVQYTLLDVGDVGTTDSHFGRSTGELLQPQRDVAHHVLVGAMLAAVGVALLVDAVEVVLALGAVDGDAYREVADVLLDELLHLGSVVVDAIGREREAVAVEPVMAQAEHLGLEVVAYLVNQVNLHKRFAANEVPNHALLTKVILVAQNIVDSSLRGLPRHLLLLILPHKVTILTSQLAILRDNKRDVLSHARLPCLATFFNFFHR